jgi:hypothetical protein
VFFCGRVLVPDSSVSERQKACPKEGCKRSRKRISQRLWGQKNRDYFKDHYSIYVKSWPQRRRILEEGVIIAPRESREIFGHFLVDIGYLRLYILLP